MNTTNKDTDRQFYAHGYCIYCGWTTTVTSSVNQNHANAIAKQVQSDHFRFEHRDKIN